MTSHAVPNVAANLCATLNSVRSACMFFGVRTTSTRASESATRSERLPPPRTNDNAPRTRDAIAPTAALPTAPAALTPRLNAPAMSPVRSPTAPIPGAGSKSRDDIERGPLVDASTGARSRSRSRSDSEGAARNDTATRETHRARRSRRRRRTPGSSPGTRAKVRASSPRRATPRAPTST